MTEPRLRPGAARAPLEEAAVPGSAGLRARAPYNEINDLEISLFRYMGAV